MRGSAIPLGGDRIGVCFALRGHHSEAGSRRYICLPATPLLLAHGGTIFIEHIVGMVIERPRCSARLRTRCTGERQALPWGSLASPLRSAGPFPGSLPPRGCSTLRSRMMLWLGDRLKPFWTLQPFRSGELVCLEDGKSELIRNVHRHHPRLNVSWGFEPRKTEALFGRPTIQNESVPTQFSPLDLYASFGSVLGARA
jgi:hypothetical protein